MKEILISQLVNILVAIPIAFIVLRILFKKSILLNIGIIFAVNLILVSFVGIWQSAGYTNKLVSFVIIAILTIISVVLIANMVKNPCRMQ